MAEEIDFHSERWLAEIEMANRAGHPRAIRAHLGLSTLHFRRMLNLSRERHAGNEGS